MTNDCRKTIMWYTVPIVPFDRPPFARATITDGVVTLNRWAPDLVRSGPAAAVLEAVSATGIALFDLTLDARADGNEVIAATVTPGSNPAAEEALVGWARNAGYRRIWLPQRIVSFEGPTAAQLAGARVTCPTCRASWSDHSLSFIAGVRSQGYFPATCCACGGSLPEWEIEGEQSPEGPLTIEVQPMYEAGA